MQIDICHSSVPMAKCCKFHAAEHSKSIQNHSWSDFQSSRERQNRKYTHTDDIYWPKNKKHNMNICDGFSHLADEANPGRVNDAAGKKCIYLFAFVLSPPRQMQISLYSAHVKYL